MRSPRNRFPQNGTNRTGERHFLHFRRSRVCFGATRLGQLGGGLGSSNRSAARTDPAVEHVSEQGWTVGDNSVHTHFE